MGVCSVWVRACSDAAHHVVEDCLRLLLVVLAARLHVQLVVDPHRVPKRRCLAQDVQRLRRLRHDPERGLARLVDLLDAAARHVALDDLNVQVRAEDLLDADHRRLAVLEPVVVHRVGHKRDGQAGELRLLARRALAQPRVRLAPARAEDLVVLRAQLLPRVLVAQQDQRRHRGDDRLAPASTIISLPGGNRKRLVLNRHGGAWAGRSQW